MDAARGVALTGARVECVIARRCIIESALLRFGAHAGVAVGWRAKLFVLSEVDVGRRLEKLAKKSFWPFASQTG